MAFYYCVFLSVATLAGTRTEFALPYYSYVAAVPGPESNQSEACRELKPGESRDVNDPEQLNPSRLQRVYRMTRSKENPSQYHVEIPIEFNNKLTVMNGNDVEKQTAEFRIKYLEMANGCFEKYKGKIRDPDGNEFHLQLVQKSKDPKTQPAKVDISWESRSHTRQWSYNIDCPTVIHESLHLMGLVDCYHEKNVIEVKPWFRSRFMVSEFNCRSNKGEISIMNSETLALDPQYNVLNCHCVKQSECENAPFHAEETDSRSCPPGYQPAEQKTISQPSWNRWQNLSFIGVVLLAKKIPPPPYSLQRTEAQFLLKPYCTRDNNYLACSQNTYRTKEVDGCLTLPKDCP